MAAPELLNMILYIERVIISIILMNMTFKFDRLYHVLHFKDIYVYDKRKKCYEAVIYEPLIVTEIQHGNMFVIEKNIILNGEFYMRI